MGHPLAELGIDVSAGVCTGILPCGEWSVRHQQCPCQKGGAGVVHSEIERPIRLPEAGGTGAHDGLEAGRREAGSRNDQAPDSFGYRSCPPITS